MFGFIFNGLAFVFRSIFQKDIRANSQSPVSFGYKMIWIALKTSDQQEVVRRLKLRSSRESTWKKGIGEAYNSDDKVFVTPAINDWTLVAGWGIAKQDTRGPEDEIPYYQDLIKSLSKYFREAQLFVSHRVSEYHAWMSAENGEMKRCFIYAGDLMKILRNEGTLTSAETSLGITEDNKTTAIPDENFVMQIAASWSIDPTKLEERENISNAGVTGRWKL